MNETTFRIWVIAIYIFKISLVVGAVFMAINGIKWWGFLILVAGITGVKYKYET